MTSQTDMSPECTPGKPFRPFAKAIGCGLVALAMLMLPTLSRADFTVGLDEVYYGPNPAGAAPWATATFKDGTGANAGKVILTFTATNITGDEFISSFDFNFNPAKNLGHLSFANSSGVAFSDVETYANSEPGNVPLTLITFFDGEWADSRADLSNEHSPLNTWDIEVDYSDYWGLSTVPSHDSTSTIIISSSDPGLKASDFLFGTPFQGVPELIAAHVFDIKKDRCDYQDDWIGADLASVATPEPGTLFLLGLGVLGAVVSRRMRAAA